jgi:carboxypeptidase Taq
MATAYESLQSTFERLHRFQHLKSIAGWDQAANMPAKGNEARAAATAEMAALIHSIQTDPKLGDWIRAAEGESLDPTQKANLREIRRTWLSATALPEELVRAQELATARCEHAWRAQRPANDWKGFLGNFEEVLMLAREQAKRLSDVLEVSPYEAMMSLYEPGLRTADLDRWFGDLRSWLPGLIRDVTQKQSLESVEIPQGPFDLQAQRDLCEKVMRALGFDFEAGRLDVSTHPFCGGVPEDVRITTRFRSDEFLPSLYGTIHETGHARYEQNLPRTLLGQPVARARSMALHESQSLFFEMQLGCHPGFVQRLAPMVSDAFGKQPAFAAENLVRLLTRVKPGYIRVDADEVTYPAHILLRYDIERALIEGRMEARDIPERWDQLMQELLGVDTRGNYRDGPLQDIHWPAGLFGYFPCYTLGAMYAAQWFASMKASNPAIDDAIARWEFDQPFGWLRDNIWSQASQWTTDELATRASGSPLNPEHFKAHLTRRYL